MDKESQILVLRDNAKNELLQIASIEQGLTYLNKVKALETWAEAEKKDAELVLIMAEQRVRAQGTIGRLIKEAQENGDLLKSGEHKKNAVANGNSIKTLSEVGIDRKDASFFKRIATIPEDTLNEFVNERKSEGKKISTKGAVELADSLNDKKTVLSNSKRIEEKLELEDKVKILLFEINKMPALYRLKIKQGIK